MKRALWLAAAMAGAVQAAEVAPLWNLNFMAGQHFFQGRTSSLGGNVNLSYTPAVTFNDRWSLFPTYTGTYEGTRDVQELAGGGTLFQDSTSHGLLIKGVRRWGDRWKIKPSVGARVALLRETADEDWGEGLFDSRKFSGGIETEYAASPQAGGRLAYDVYALAFPNYRSLESAADPTLSRELAGEKVLDSLNHLVTLSAWAPLPEAGRWEATVYANRRDFSDQPVVDQTGGLTGTDRTDTSLAVGVQSSYPLTLGARGRGLGELALGYGVQRSNQNHYDALKAVYIPDYYDYTEWSLAPHLTAALGGSPWMASWGAAYQVRTYAERPAQNGNGDYLSDALTLRILSTTLGVSYRVAEHMRLRFQTAWAWSDSNSDYNAVFRYNYRMANYMMGFSYDY